MRQSRSLLQALILASTILASTRIFSQAPDARQRIAQLANDTSLLREGMQPWHLVMSFDLYDLAGKPKETGSVEEWWVTPTQRRIVITSPSFNQTIPDPGGKEPHTANRESFLVHNLIEQVVDPIPRFSDKEDLSVEQETKILGKVKLSCLTVSRSLKAVKGKALSLPGPVFCLNPDSDVLRVVFEDDQGKAIIRNRLARFRDTNIALDNTVNYYGKLAISGKVTKLEAYDPTVDPVALTKVNRSPAVIPSVVIAGKVTKKVQPVYPELAKMKRIGGTVVLTGVISQEGRIQSLDVVSSPDPLLSNAALAAVQQWEYQPYLLNGAATEVQTTITVHFNLNFN
jgi:TonB family protein